VKVFAVFHQNMDAFKRLFKIFAQKQPEKLTIKTNFHKKQPKTTLSEQIKEDANSAPNRL